MGLNSNYSIPYGVVFNHATIVNGMETASDGSNNTTGAGVKTDMLTDM